MNQKNSGQSEKQSPLNVAAADLGAQAQKRFEEFAEMQTEWFGLFGETNQQWLNLMQAEADLASELASKLSGAKSVPDVMAAYRQWGKRHFELMAEDAKCTMDAAQKIMQTGAHLIASGFAPESLGTST